MEQAEPDAIFLADGDSFVPTAFARGPWDPDAQTTSPLQRVAAGRINRSVQSLLLDSPSPGVSLQAVTGKRDTQRLRCPISDS
ncbi:MAG: hypothetical protein ACXW2Y_00485 [Acidimicrobiia bacterium]